MKTPAYRPIELLSKSDFIRYCADYDVYVGEKDLQTLHQQRLLVPMIRLIIGVVEYRKIYATFDGAKSWRYVTPENVSHFKPEQVDKQKYYTVAGIYRNGKDWLDWYKKRKMVKYPWEGKFRPWIEQKIYDFTTKWREINTTEEIFYEKYQMLLLKEILRTKRMYAAFPGKGDTDFVTAKLKGEAKRFYEFMDFYIDVEDFFEQAEKVKRENWLKNLKDYNGDRKEAKREWDGHFEQEYIPAFENRAKQLLKQHKLTAEQVKDWQYWLARKTMLSESRFSSGITGAYLKGLDDTTLIKAEDVNYMIYVLNQIIDLATGERLTVRQVLGDSGGYCCVICHQLFEPSKYPQFTCGKPDCVRKHQNELKRKNRKSGKYKPR